MSILDRIMAVKRVEVAAAKQTVSATEMQSRAQAGPPMRDFVASIRAKIAHRQPAVIAEIKRASPSRGVLREQFDPAAIAKSYEAAGAACLSVLTDREFFQGSIEHLEAARSACSLPVLRKDFIFDPYQVHEARAMGADCVLLIAACLSRDETKTLESVADALGMAVLVEIHDAAELKLALELKTPLLGINNRDLRTFETHIDATLALLPEIPKERIVITESGILAAKDVALMRARGVNAFLVGEAFMRAADPGAALKNLFV